MIGDELRRLFTWQERHHRLLARLLIAFFLTLFVDAVGAVLSYETVSSWTVEKNNASPKPWMSPLLACLSKTSSGDSS